VKNRKTKIPAKDETNEILIRCWKKGLLLISGGLSVIRIAPPLNLEEKLIFKGLQILEEEIKKVNENIK
jgi:4-aminobutyrate aminotransferase-like enzyme